MRVLVFDIQRCSIHDGPGIRTTVFLKGCNLRCLWCENPESLSPSPQVAYARNRCIGCRSCTRACPRGAIAIGSAYPIEKSRCEACGACAAACPTGALRVLGIWREVDELVSELVSDRTYFSGSGGGVTVSGGEASLQVNGLRALLRRLRRENVHTTLQTHGAMAWERLHLLARDVSLFLFDLKGIDPARHREHTGAPNERVLENARRLSQGGFPVVFRIPLVPGFNDAPEDLLQLKAFLDTIEARAVDVLPYHNLGERKLEWIGAGNSRLSLPAMTRADAVAKAHLLEGHGRQVTVGGENLPDP